MLRLTGINLHPAVGLVAGIALVVAGFTRPHAAGLAVVGATLLVCSLAGTYARARRPARSNKKL
jgi:hypothetical protein